MKIFYSWQSNLPVQKNKIANCISKALKSINRDLDLELAIDRDTKNTSGAVEIADQILLKIATARVFIADITLINNSKLLKILRYEITPNPNVLIELGYAVRKIGWENIILLANTKYGCIEELPFDLRHRRIMSFREINDELTKSIGTAIRDILSKNSINIPNRDLDEIHDIEVFNRINANIPERNLPSLFEHIGNTGTYHGTETNFIYNLNYEVNLPMNNFINQSLQEKSYNLGKCFNQLAWFLAKNFYNYNNDDVYQLNKYSNLDEEEADKLIIDVYKNLNHELDNAIKAYNDFRKFIKSDLKV